MVYRHSYAMHMLYAGIPLKVLQSLMGYKSISSTEVYTKVFALDVAARHRVQFSMPEPEFTHGLIRMLWANYLRPVPAMTDLASRCD